jgi:phytoene synthase
MPSDSHAYVNAVTRKSGSNFYLAFFSLPRPQREALTAVYAFCREVDDAVDDPGEKNPKQAVEFWREEIARTYEGKPTLPLTRSLAAAIERFQLSREYFDGILNGVAMDLDRLRYPTFNALLEYCYHVAGEVGLLCMEIFGYRSERLKRYAITMGNAFQLTNILRDVGADADNGRIYLPQEDLARFGVDEKDILAKRFTPQFGRLMAFEGQRARGFYRDALVLPTVEERPHLRAAEIMRAIYEDILRRIEQRRYDVFGTRVRVPTPTKLYLTLKTWWDYRG